MKRTGISSFTAKTVSRTTLQHDAIAAKSFFKWSAQNDLINRSPLADYEIKESPRTAKYMPTEADIQKLLKAVHDFYELSKHPQMQEMNYHRRLLHQTRNKVVLLVLLDRAARIGEIIGLIVDDYRSQEHQILIRESKGKEPRTLPLSPSIVMALNE